MSYFRFQILGLSLNQNYYNKQQIENYYDVWK